MLHKRTDRDLETGPPDAWVVSTLPYRMAESLNFRQPLLLKTKEEYFIVKVEFRLGLR